MNLDIFEYGYNRGQVLFKVESSNVGDWSRGTGRDARTMPGAFADPEDILLSAVAAESVGTAVGSRCCHRNDRKTKREPRTRLGVNLIFYSTARSWCVSTSTFELGSR